MTADQTIALLASIGACLSAFATFLTVRQIAKQREASYRPELAFSRTLFDARSNPLRNGVLPEMWVSKHPDSGALMAFDFSMPLRNVGLGTAKEVVILWSFPIDQTIECVNQAAQRTLTPAYFSSEDSGDSVSIKSESLGNGISMWQNQKKELVDFVLPASVQKEPVEVKLPHVYVQLCSAAVYFRYKDKGSLCSVEVPRLTADIEYSDIGNRKHRMIFDFEVHVIIAAGGGEAFSGYVNCTKRV